MTTDRVAPNRMLRALLGFTAAQVALVVLAAVLMQRFVWTDPASAGAVRASAWLAVIVQTFTFAIAMLVARTQVMAGWGLGVLLRAATLAFWAFLGADALGLPTTPALISLVVFYFVSTVIEPIFLNAH
jgi:hypothetical protein